MASDDQRQAWRLLAGELDAARTAMWQYRRIAARAGLLREIAQADSYLVRLNHDHDTACRHAGYATSEEVFKRIDEEADTQPEMEVVK